MHTRIGSVIGCGRESLLRFRETPTPGCEVEIAGYAYGAPVIASSTTGKDGHFSIFGAKPGRYWLRARHPAAGHLDVEFRLGRIFKSRPKSLMLL
jgi:hypothetical protein